MHTADQARELWCPMVRIARHEFYERDESGHGHITSHQVIVGGCNTDALGVGNGEPRRMSRDHKPLASCRCIADKCAMWRWDTRSTGPFDDPVGYCGLAGSPELTT